MRDKGKNLVLMENVSSMEHYKFKDGTMRRVLNNLNFKCHEGECVVVIGGERFEIRLFLEIISNVKPYDKGKCILLETGMMRRKRVILDHTFYIGSTELLINNMNVLEYLMFVTSKSLENVLDRQEKIIDFLILIKGQYLTLVNISKLTWEEKSIISLVVAYLSLSKLIVFNLPNLSFNKREVEIIKNLSQSLMKEKRALIISTENHYLSNEIATNIVVIEKGRVRYTGEKSEYVESFDKVIMDIEMEDLECGMRKFKESLPLFEYEIKNNALRIYNYKSVENYEKLIYNIILSKKLRVRKIIINIKNLENAYEEMVKNNDLQ